jgi:hypothetical protein
LYSAENLRLCVMTPSWPIMSLNQVSAKAGQNPDKNVIDNVIEFFWKLNGTEISDQSHKEFAWRLTGEGETIAFRTAWLSAEPLSLDQIELGQHIAKKHGLTV